jgi:hypothetical protein
MLSPNKTARREQKRCLEELSLKLQLAKEQGTLIGTLFVLLYCDAGYKPILIFPLTKQLKILHISDIS